MKTFTPSSKNILLFFMTFLKLGNTRTKHNKLPAIAWNFYHDAATKLLRAENCIVITSN